VASLQVSHTAAVWLAYVDTGHTATYLFMGLTEVTTDTTYTTDHN